jgi:hypothetical protein
MSEELKKGYGERQGRNFQKSLNVHGFQLLTCCFAFELIIQLTRQPSCLPNLFQFSLQSLVPPSQYSQLSFTAKETQRPQITVVASLKTPPQIYS